MSVRTPEAAVWDTLRGALGTRALAVVAELGVADALGDAERPVTEVAAEVGAEPDALRRLLRALASDGIFVEDSPGVFRNTEASSVLRGESGWGDFARLFGGVFYRPVGHLDATGEVAFPRVFGADFWSWLADNPAERAVFDRAMMQGKERRTERLASAGWREGETVVDVGGGNGSLLADLLGRQPSLRGIVFDLPETVRDETALGDRCRFVAGSFFERVPTGDTYVLSGILHDWDDDRALAILRTIRASAPPRARVVILDAVVPEGNEPHGAKWLDVLMLATLGGRERDEAQWNALLEQAGLAVERIEDGLIVAACR
jgi:hypothetical protein